MDEAAAIADHAAMRLVRSLLASLTALSCACGLNPAFNSPTEGEAGPIPASSTGGESEASVTLITGSSSSGDPTTSAGDTTTGGPGTTTTTGGSGTTGSPETTTSGESSGGALPGVYEVPASIGTCVFVANDVHPFHGGPDECSGDADAINNTELAGLMMVDVQVNDAAGQTRPAVPVLRFDIPGELAGLTVAAVTLHVQVSDGVTSLPQSGEVWQSEPFDAMSLTMSAPALSTFVAPDKGEVQPDDWLAWELAPGLISAGAPLHLALKPTHDKGVILRGATTAESAPYLTLEMQ